MSDFSKGSVWRKWDLQLHCPVDVLENQFDGKDTDEKWEKLEQKPKSFQNAIKLWDN